MPSHQTLATSIQDMTSALEKIKQEELTLTEMMEAFSNAIQVYQQFEASMESDSLDVKEVKISESGALKEYAFEWKSM